MRPKSQRGIRFPSLDAPDPRGRQQVRRSRDLEQLEAEAKDGRGSPPAAEAPASGLASTSPSGAGGS